MSATDLLDRPINIGDYVIFYNNIYQVVNLAGNNYARIMLFDPSKTTKPVKKYSKEMYIIDKEEILIWKLKRGY